MTCLCLIAVMTNAARVVDGINYEFDRDNMLAYVVAADDSSPYSGKIVIPDKVKVGNNEFTVVGINNSAFSNSKITSISLPNTIIEIQDYAFYECDGLTVAYLPDGIKTIGKKAFAWCENIVDISLPNNSEVVVGSEAFRGLKSLRALTIPDSWTHVGDDTHQDIFRQCGFTQLTIGKNVRKIGPSSFCSCEKLSEIICPKDGVLEEIGNSAFSDCESIKSTKFLPLTIKKIGGGAFYHCYAMEEFFIHASIDSICSGSCELKAKRLILDDGSTPYTFFNGSGWPIFHPVYAYLGREMINFDPYSKYQLFGRNNLKRVDFGPYFKGGPELRFGENVEVIYSYVTDPSVITCEFEENVYDNATLYVPVGLVDKYMAQENFSKFFDVREFYPEAFLGYLWHRRGLVEFEDITVKNICLDNWDTNYDCEIDETEVQAIKDIDGKFYAKQISSFDEFKKFSGVKEIPKRAFAQNPLTSIVFPKAVEIIGESAFQFTHLKSIDLPASVITIGRNAFANIEELAMVKISKNVESIGNSAFWGCTLLKDIYCEAEKVPSAESNSFWDPVAYNNATLHVPSAVLDDYRSTAPWKNFKNIKAITGEIIDSSYDVNNDGSLDEDDLKGLVEKILGHTDGTDVLNNVYDANNDGKIDITDIVQLIGLSNDIKEGRLLDIDEENEGGYEDLTETELQIMEMESDEDEVSEIVYTDEDSLEYDALAKEVISLYDTDDDSDYSVTEVNKTRGSYDDLAKEAIRTNGKNIFDDEIDIEQQSRNLKNWGNTRYGGFKVFYNTREEDYVRYLYVVFYYKGGFPNKKTAYLKLGQLNSGKIISSTNKSGQKISSVTISPGQEIAVLRVCIDKYLPGYGCFNVFPLLITEESKARNYQNPIFVKSKQIVDKDWRNKYYGYEFGKINGVSVYFNADSKEGNNNMGNGWHQCVELCKRYVKQLNSDLNRKETDTWGNAINWPYNRKNETKDPDKYLVFDNDGSERVREGDLLVWKHGDYGHIGVVISVKADRISVAHQNGGTGTYALPIGTSMKLENGVIKDIVPNTNRSPIFKSIQPVTHFIRINSPNEHTTSYNASMTASTTNMAFTPAQVGKSITQTFIINNPKGMDKLEISSITLSRGDAFSVDVTNCSIEPGDAKVVRVTFTPAASGEYKDRIIIKSNADDNPTWAIHLTGSGI